jgi:hypothetical protein
MRKYVLRVLAIFTALFLLGPIQPVLAAEESVLSLSEYIGSGEKRHFVEAMISYHLRENEMVQ